MKTKLTILAVLLLILAGCGDFEFLPDPNTQTFHVGGFISSTRNSADNNFTTRTDRGIFETYTSLRVAVKTPVVLEKRFDPQTNLLLGQMLSSQGQSTLIKTVISLM